PSSTARRNASATVSFVVDVPIWIAASASKSSSMSSSVSAIRDSSRRGGYVLQPGQPMCNAYTWPYSTARLRSLSSLGVSADLLHDLVGDVEVGVDVLDVVAVLEGVDQPEDPPGVLLLQRHGHAGQERRLGGLVVDAGGLQRGADRDQVTRLADHLEGLAEVVDLLGAGVQHGDPHVVLGPAGLPAGQHTHPVGQCRHSA